MAALAIVVVEARVLLAVIRAFAMAEGGCGAPLGAPGFLEREDYVALA